MDDLELISRLKGRGGKVSNQDRRKLVEIVDQLRVDPELVAAKVTVDAICKALHIAAKTYYRWKADPDGEDKRATCKRAPNPRSLSPEEKQQVLALINSEEVADKSVTQAYMHYLDQGVYIASESTIRRLLREKGVDQSTRRDGIRNSRAPGYRPDEYVASAPNMVWTWDGTLFRGRYAGQFYCVYVAIDIYSRLIVGYGVYEADNAENAIDFLTRAFDEHAIKRNQLVLHSDNGSAMRAADTLAMLKERGVIASHSRPRVSNDNAYSESLFSTLNIRKGLDSRRYDSLEECQEAVRKAVEQYNNEHHHRGINYVTPAERHAGRDAKVLAKRKETLEFARAKNPNRWIKNRVMNCEPAGAQYLNPSARGATVTPAK